MNYNENACSLILRHLEAFMLPPQTLDPSFTPPVHDAHLLYLLSLYNILLLSSPEKLVVDPAFITSLTENFLSAVFTEDLISIQHYSELPRLQTLTSILYDHLLKSPMPAFQTLVSLLERCYLEHKLTNLASIQQQVNEVLAPLMTERDDLVQECFKELQQIISGMVEYANVTCTRIRQVSAAIHIRMGELSGKILTMQLNSIIKPLLQQVKRENVTFI